MSPWLRTISERLHRAQAITRPAEAAASTEALPRPRASLAATLKEEVDGGGPDFPARERNRLRGAAAAHSSNCKPDAGRDVFSLLPTRNRNYGRRALLFFSRPTCSLTSFAKNASRVGNESSSFCP